MSDPRRAWTSVAVDLRRSMTPKGRLQTGKMVVEGVRLVSRALRSGCTPRQVLAGESLALDPEHERGSLWRELREAGCEVYFAPDEELLELSDGRNSGLFVGLCELPRIYSSVAELPPRSTGPLLCLVQVEEPGNVGAMIRTALASGARAVLTVGGCDVFHPKAIRTSLGSLFSLPLVRVNGIDQALESTRGMTRLAAVAQCGSAPWAVKIDRPPALFMGNEGSGLPESLVELLDAPVTIPMPPGVDSFSVNAAAAVLLYELQRRSATTPRT